MEFPIRINKYLQATGVASRREADQLIESGLVQVNGKRAQLGMLVQEGDKVEVSQRYKKDYQYFIYYKPRGLATQALGGGEDVISEFKKLGLYPIGRLDKDSEGLMLLTNDGRVTSRVLDSENKFEKEYSVRVKEKLRHGIEDIFAKGMNTEAFGKLLPAQARILTDTTMRIILHEGKKHQIRVMLNDLGYTIISLKRVRVGNLRLGTLQPGESRPLTLREIKEIIG